MTSLENQRKTDNESVFRKYNEAVTHGLNNLVAVAEREGWGSDIKNTDDALHFYCECSREDCHERILIKPSDYMTIHADRMFFTVKNGHETKEVEKVIEETLNYTIVEKFEKPHEDVDKLQKTDLTDGSK